MSNGLRSSVGVWEKSSLFKEGKLRLHFGFGVMRNECRDLAGLYRSSQEW